ncbi:M1 family metallopeptidase [Halobacillus sp. Marseille-Q1614]|uniref:M1 family metallopeptidase n=1 Tax=Halobacillus sp. Marseille-Q1614 TaxID=2709134 RepID=UPI00157000C6|nr:M1 family metallopeptidase [Halobacillus sp. Marseille-Q1614]
MILLLILLTSCNSIGHKEELKENKAEFSPMELPAGSKSNYDLSLSLDENGEFKVKASIEITNLSKDAWESLVFYFIPNMFTQDNAPELDKPGSLNVQKVSVNGKEVNYFLEKDTFTVPLKEKVQSKEEKNIEITYSFTLPEKGHRYTENDSNYYLAQWYPMVPTYRDGWNKEEYRSKGESYHTTFSDFDFSYKVPEEYTVITSSDTENLPTLKEQKVKAESVKEFYVAILRHPEILEKEKQGVTIRIFSSDQTNRKEEVLETALQALDYFQNKIGPYPHKQLDIILSDIGMEYPGVVTVDNSRGVRMESLKDEVVHEIAHQWFYGVINNDPYRDAWLDEGLANLATSLFLADVESEDVQLPNEFYPNLQPVNLPLDHYQKDYHTQVYGNSPIGLWNIFRQHGGKEAAENFLTKYYLTYKYKEVNTEEFTRFLNHQLDIKDPSIYDDWLQLKHSQ